MKPHIKKVNGVWECRGEIYTGRAETPKLALYNHCLCIQVYPTAIVSDIEKVIDCWHKRNNRRG